MVSLVADIRSWSTHIPLPPQKEALPALEEHQEACNDAHRFSTLEAKVVGSLGAVPDGIVLGGDALAGPLRSPLNNRLSWIKQGRKVAAGCHHFRSQ